MNIGHCSWAFSNEMTRTYHDTEWGIPVYDETKVDERNDPIPQKSEVGPQNRQKLRVPLV